MFTVEYLAKGQQNKVKVLHISVEYLWATFPEGISSIFT